MTEEQNEEKLPKKRERQLRVYMSDRAKLHAALASVLSRKKQSPRARKLAAGDIPTIKRGILDLFGHLPPEARLRAHQKICHEYDFCNNRRDLAYCLLVLPTVTAILSMYAIPFSVIVAVIVYRPMNILCDCDDHGDMDRIGEALLKKTEKTGSRINKKLS